MRSANVSASRAPRRVWLRRLSARARAHLFLTDRLAKVIDGAYDSVLSGYTIVDCRFHYEYAGGHVRGGKLLNRTCP